MALLRCRLSSSLQHICSTLDGHQTTHNALTDHVEAPRYCTNHFTLQPQDFKLQDTFSQLRSQLTHLSFGLGDMPRELQLSAPVNCMPALQSLICQPGFTLDT
jgi:hypothetical protein